MAQNENESILGFDEARESLVIDESSFKVPIQIDSTPISYFEKTMEVRISV